MVSSETQLSLLCKSLIGIPAILLCQLHAYATYQIGSLGRFEKCHDISFNSQTLCQLSSIMAGLHPKPLIQNLSLNRKKLDSLR